VQQFVNHNGEILPDTTPLFTSDNRSLQYGDGLFETIRLVNGVPLFFEDHFHRLLSGMIMLQMQFEGTLDMNYFVDQIKMLSAQNKNEDAARVRLSVYRKTGGFYTPEAHEIGFVIQTESLAEKRFEVQQKGLKIDIYKETPKLPGRLSNLKTANCLTYILAGLYKKQKSLDDCLLLNTYGAVVESISSNIFIVRQGVLITPPLNDGCVAGIMRMQILKIARQYNKKVIEKSISPDELLLADEVFLTNAISGIRWVVAFRNKRYFNTTAKWFVEQLNLLVG
jgi:branched-subunit amino acid aminotransferase/4-amino-4-deoxychorismate lyase